MEGRPRREIKVPAKFKEEEETAPAKKKKGVEEDANLAVYCVCRKPYKEGDFMIHCDKCKEWFHGNCVKVTQKEAAKIKKYVCPSCLIEEEEKKAPAAPPLLLEDPAKIPKKHRSLEAAKGDKLPSKAGARPGAPAEPGATPELGEGEGAAKDASAAKPSEKAENASEAGEDRKALEGPAKGADKGGKDGKEGAGLVRQRPKKEDLVCSACKQKGHIRTHRECPLFGKLPTPAETKKAALGAVKEKPSEGGPSEEEAAKDAHRSDEDEPILARKKAAPSPKAPPLSPPASAAAVLPSAPPPAGEEEEQAHMLHPVNTSSHFDTGATLLKLPPTSPPPLDTTAAALPLVTRLQAALVGGKRKTEASLEGGDTKKARPDIPPLEAASGEVGEAGADASVVAPLAFLQANPGGGSPQPGGGSGPPRTATAEVRSEQGQPHSPRQQAGPVEGQPGAQGPVLRGLQTEQAMNEQGGRAFGQGPMLSKQGSSKGQKRGREGMEEKTEGSKGEGSKTLGLDSGHPDFKVRTISRTALANALALIASDMGQAAQPGTPRDTGDKKGANTERGAGGGKEPQGVGGGNGVLEAEEQASPRDDAAAQGPAVPQAARGEAAGLDPGGSRKAEQQAPVEGGAAGRLLGGTGGPIHQDHEGPTEHNGPAGKHPLVDAAVEAPTSSEQMQPQERGGGEERTVRLGEEVAHEIEAALYASFGGTGNAYRQQNRMLVFNLKDPKNPELRTKVLTREITASQLASATADQLARKELSQWRHAKEEQLDALKVLTEDPLEALRRVRKKTHKGEQDVERDKDTMAATRGEGADARLKEEGEGGGEGGEASAGNGDEEHAGSDGAVLEHHTTRQGPAGGDMAAEEGQRRGEMAKAQPEVALGKEGRQAGSTTSGAEDPVVMRGASSSTKKTGRAGGTLEGMGGKEAPEGGLSLEAYLEACMTAEISEEGSEEGGDADVAEWVASDDEEEGAKQEEEKGGAGSAPGRPAGSQGVREGGQQEEESLEDLLWEGDLILSGKACPTIASFLGGERMVLETWPLRLEVKGRVKVADLSAFLTSPQLPKHRTLMCAALKSLHEGAPASNPLAAAAQSYLDGKRVGYGEPLPGLEVYLLPPTASALTALLPLQDVAVQDAGDLIAVVVKRRGGFPDPSSQPERGPGSGPPRQQERLHPALGTGEDVRSPQPSPTATGVGQPGVQAWSAKEEQPQQLGSAAGGERVSAELHEQARKHRDPRLRIFHPTSSPPALPAQLDAAGPPGFSLPRAPPAVIAPPLNASPGMPSLPPPPLGAPPSKRSPGPLQSPAHLAMFQAGARPPISSAGVAPLRPPLPPGPPPVLRGAPPGDDDLPDAELPDLRFHQASMRPWSPGVLPPLPPGPPPPYVHASFPYVGHPLPRGPTPHLPPGPPPPISEHPNGRRGTALYAGLPRAAQGPPSASSGAPQWGHEKGRKRHKRGGTGQRQNTSADFTGEGYSGGEQVMQQWLQQEEGASTSDGGGNEDEQVLGEWQPPNSE